MKINLKDKKALIGGSSKGLGYAVAKQLAVCGAMVTLVSRNETLLKKNMIELKKRLPIILDLWIIISSPKPSIEKPRTSKPQQTFETVAGEKTFMLFIMEIL